MYESKSVLAPIQSHIDALMIFDEAFPATAYRKAVGSLMYLMKCTRPDLVFAVCRLPQFMKHPTYELWTYVKRVMRYLKKTISAGTIYDGLNKCGVVMAGFCGPDWAGYQIEQKSTTSYVSRLHYSRWSNVVEIRIENNCYNFYSRSGIRCSEHCCTRAHLAETNNSVCRQSKCNLSCFNKYW